MQQLNLGPYLDAARRAVGVHKCRYEDDYMVQTGIEGHEVRLRNTDPSHYSDHWTVYVVGADRKAIKVEFTANDLVDTETDENGNVKAATDFKGRIIYKMTPKDFAAKIVELAKQVPPIKLGKGWVEQKMQARFADDTLVPKPDPFDLIILNPDKPVETEDVELVQEPTHV